MVGLPILRPGGTTGIVPIKEDNHARCRLNAVIGPLPTVFEPLDAVDTACKFRNHTSVDVAALVGTPAHEAGAPFHTGTEPTSSMFLS